MQKKCMIQTLSYTHTKKKQVEWEPEPAEQEPSSFPVP